MPQSASDIDDDAADWAARLDGRPGDDGGVETWLAGDPRRAGALLRARAALSLLDRARALPKPDLQPNPSMPRRRLLVGGGTLLAAGIGGLAFLHLSAERYQAGVGEIRRVPLADGSSATLNTATRLAVQLDKTQRNIRLDQGEAWFRVAKDRTRPFVVAAGDVRVRAVGTAFSVRRQGDGVLVLVTEGVVEVWREGAQGHRVKVGAGSRIVLAEGQPPQPIFEPAQNIDDALAWRQGLIVMRGMSLGEAAADFNRYNARKLIVDDPDLAAETVVGRFRTDEPEAFASSVAIALEAGVEVRPDAIVLRRPRASQ